MSLSPPPHLVADDDGLSALAAALDGAATLALDTEFHAERRYRPALALVQLATRDRCWLVDALACDLRPLGPVLAGATLLVHGGHHDLALLTRATGVRPRAVVDTQCLAAFCGLGFPRRLDDLLGEVLGHAPPPALTLTDWLSRPLPEQALAYAAADVQLLWPLADALRRRVEALGNEVWAEAASLDLLDGIDAPPRDPASWREWDIAPHMSPGERAVLQALMEWRDRRGRERDQPPWYLLGDSLALGLARLQPATVQDLRADRRIGAGLRKRMGPDLVGVVGAALAGPAPAAVPPDAPQRRALLQLWAAAWGRDRGMAGTLLLPGDVLRVVAEEGPDALAGWRRRLLHAPLGRLWAGEVAIARGPEGLRLALVDPVRPA